MIIAAVSAGAVVVASRWSTPRSARSTSASSSSASRSGNGATWMPDGSGAWPGPVDGLRRRHRHRQVRPPMERPGEHDDVRPAGHLLGQLDRRLGDLGAGVGEEERVDAPGTSSASRAANGSSRSWVNTLAWRWMPRAACRRSPRRRAGWLWPVELTAMPAAKSRYSTPSTVVTRQPCPLATCRSVTLNHTLDKCDMRRDYACGVRFSSQASSTSSQLRWDAGPNCACRGGTGRRR